MKKKYELLYVLNGTLTDEALKEQMTRVQAVVEAVGEVEEVFIWGRRRLAYEIQDLRDGYYVIIHFHAEPDQPQKIESLLRITDFVLRYLITVSENDYMPSVKQLSDKEIDKFSVEDPEELVEQMIVESAQADDVISEEETVESVEESVEQASEEAEAVETASDAVEDAEQTSEERTAE
ncbi:MAG: 30S ribosomal protein S6 [Eubacteriales bacterium]|nr:30S ribosomal protein S6 [Eubacteriales bacterium]MDD4324719.1 30S ribosomal protein S6 [Eubacteriales bacterium]